MCWMKLMISVDIIFMAFRQQNKTVFSQSCDLQVPEECTSASPTLSARPTTECGARSLPRGSTGTSSGNCQETETQQFWTCCTPWQHLQNHPQGILVGGQCRGRQSKRWMDNVRVDIPAYTRTAHNSLLQKRLEEILCWNIHRAPPPSPAHLSRDWTELNWIARKCT